MSATAINVPAIEKELTQLWKQASDDESGGVVRASILNLIIFVPDPAECKELDDVIMEITAAHPCRVIALVADRSSDSKLNAEVTSRCTLPTPGSKQVCCEQVTITASGDHLDEAPSAIVPLLISDLPVFLWWRAIPNADDKHLYEMLAEIADRVIIDSARFNKPKEDLPALARVLGNAGHGLALSDVNWARVTAWRALLAGFYDLQEYCPLLSEINHVTISYAPPESDQTAISMRALLLIGWLASRLGWKPNTAATRRTDKSTTLEFDASGHPLHVEFRHTERAIPPGLLGQITLEKEGGCAFTVRRSSDGTRIETVVSMADESRPKRVLSYESLSESALISRELEITGNDHVYERAIVAASGMISSEQ